MAYIYDLADTWNSAGTSFNGIKLNVTDTASAVTSKLLDLQIGSSSKFAISKTGGVTATGIIESTVGGFKFPDGTIQTTRALGTVTSVSGTGTVSGLTLAGSITSSGSLTLGGTLTLTSGNVTSALGFTPATAAQGAKADTAVQTIASTDGSVTITGTTAIDLSVGVAGSTSNVILPIRNTTGATLTKGTAVYISGATGQISTVTKAIATSDATSAQTLGLITADLANNSNGNVTLIGSITNIDTSAYTDGQQLYLSPTTAGTLTATKPYAPQHLVYVAIVEHAHPSQGKLFVKVQNGYEMDELHDVSAQSPANNDGLFYNTSTNLWEKKSITTALGFTPYNAANPAGYITSSALSPYLTSATAATTYQPLDGDLTAIAALAGTVGFVKKTAANTYTLDTSTYLTGITSGQVITALGFTPYNATNPAGYTANTGTVTSVNLIAGTGVSVSGGPVTSSGSITVTNTAPDQVVSLTAGTNVTVTGTYPNFTIAASGGSGGSGTVTSVSGTGTVSGLTLTGTVTTSGSLTLGGTLSLTSGDVTTALGFTPYNATNPSGYLSSVSLTTNVTGTLPVGSGGSGATTLTGVIIGNGTSAFTTVTAPSGAIVGTTDTQTLANKRVTSRMNSQTTTTSPWAWNSDSFDVQAFTALANALTINADAGTPTDGQRTILRFKDNGTAQSLTWTTGSTKSFRAVGVTLPTTTVIGKTTYVGCVYNIADSRWDAVAVSQEA